MKRVSGIIAIFAAALSFWFGYVIYSGGTLEVFSKTFTITGIDNKNLGYIAMGAGSITLLASLITIIKLNSFTLAMIQIVMVLNVLLTFLYGFETSTFGFTWITISSVAFITGWLTLFL